MAGKPKKTVKKGRGFIDRLSDRDAKAVLKILARENKEMSEKIKTVARQFLSGVDAKKIAEEVFQALENLDVEDIYYHPGSTKDGYVSPNEFAWQMMCDAVESHREDMGKYQKISMETEALDYCKGILEGIYRFEHESDSEMKTWAEDCPGQLFDEILEEWRSRNAEETLAEGMQKFLRKNCREWFHG